MLEERALDPALHDRASFDCGVPELNEYLKRFANQHREQGISNAYVLVDADAPRFILGYYTLSAAEVDVAQLQEAARRKLPRYPLPCFRMGRLACHKEQQGRGLGRLLVACAVDRCLTARKNIAAFALIVDAKKNEAEAFYRHYGFTPLRDKPGTLYLPLGARK